MAGNVIVVHGGEEPPDSWAASLFLAGPTPRSADVASWRPAALEELERRWDAEGDLVVFVPEPRGEVWPDYDRQRTWELFWGDRSDVVLFWIPRSPLLPGLTTNDEWGRWKDTGRAVLGTPPDAMSVRYQRDYATSRGIPLSDTLEATVATALSLIGSGAPRAAGGRHIPLAVWRTLSFQNWLAAQNGAGNELRWARLEWTWRAGDRVFFWALHAHVYVAAENRMKTNEVVLSRPDISSVLAYRRGPTLADTEIVLIREFRTPSASSDGYVLELPGGSHPDAQDPVTLAAAEFSEETGLEISPDRLTSHHTRQLAATLSAHRQALFSVELTEPEIDKLRHPTRPQGVTTDSEITYPLVLPLRTLLTTPQADWTTLGTLTEVLLTLHNS